ncbi:hypothetical protein AwDysgo_21580 [Bacteroidales bacterium]|nr:hypothetical protein AwDysgo_21580 [Bacteroidales bacterium]
MKSAIYKHIYKLRILFIVCLFTLSTTNVWANDFGLHSGSQKESSAQEQTSLGAGQSFSDESLGLYGSEDAENPYLKAPPGGGDPIGGVPVGEGAISLSLLLGAYALFVLRHKKSLGSIIITNNKKTK